VDAELAASDAAEPAAATGTHMLKCDMELPPASQGTWSAIKLALPSACPLRLTAVRGLTPELSRATKWRRLGRIVRWCESRCLQ